MRFIYISGSDRQPAWIHQFSGNDDGLLPDIAISDMVGVFDVRQDWASPFSGRFCFHSLYGSVINSEKSLFTNDPLPHPDNIDVPHDHPSLTSFLGVPLVLDGGIMGMLGGANLAGGYSC